MVSKIGEAENMLRLLKIGRGEPGNDIEKGKVDIGNIRREKWSWDLWEKQILSTKKGVLSTTV